MASSKVVGTEADDTSLDSSRTILLLMVDQLAAKWLEVADEGVVDLPNFRALRDKGVTFENAFSINPVCSPSRASIATGLTSSGHGVGETGYDLDPAVPTFMQALQRSGWRTGAFGKLHFITQIEDLRPDYRPYGFDVVHNTEDSRAGEWLDWVRESHPEHYQAAQSTVWMTMIPELTSYGDDHINLYEEILAAQARYPASTSDAYELPFPAQVSQTAWITDRAIEFLAREEGDVFAQISYVQPHNPFAPPAEFVDRVDPSSIPEPTPAAWKIDPIPYYRQSRYRRPSYEEADWRRHR
ncbi:MAG TPA: sulfatase-like hydrolase/transferase, partial [Polyangiaceae bacterium]